MAHFKKNTMKWVELISTYEENKEDNTKMNEWFLFAQIEFNL